MRVAPRVIVLVRDHDGFGPAIADALVPSPSSGLTRSEICPFELSLEKYGVKDTKASGDLIQFSDSNGSPQVSIFLLPKHATPICALAVNEVVASISSENFSNQYAVILPYLVKALKANREMIRPASTEKELALYGAEIGGTNELTRAMISGTATPPPSLQIHSEPLACLLQIVHVLNVPTVLLIAQAGQLQSEKSTDHDLEVVCDVGQLLANRVGLSFSKERIQQREIEESRGDLEPWHAFYV